MTVHDRPFPRLNRHYVVVLAIISVLALMARLAYVLQQPSADPTGRAVRTVPSISRRSTPGFLLAS